MNKGNTTGWRDVLSFTFLQTIKSKAFIVSLVILLVMAAASMPLISILTKTGSSEITGDVGTNGAVATDASPSPIQKVYIDNQTALTDMDFSALTKDAAYKSTVFEAMKEDIKTVSDRIKTKENASVILTISLKDNLYHLDFVKAGSGPIKESHIYSFMDAAARQFEANKISSLGITQAQSAMVNAQVDTKVSLLDVNGKEIVKKDTSISTAEYWFIYGILFIVLMTNSLAGTQVATSIVTEKSTRVIEYLLITVKPLAMIIGKVIAMLAAALIQLVALIAVVFASNKITAVFLSKNGSDVLMKYLPSDVFKNLNILNIIFCIVFILLGLIFYATLAGLAGATISRLEELQEGLTLFTFTNIIGAYVAIAAISILMGSGTNAFVTFALLFPISSPFLVPGALLIGKVSLPLAAAAFALLIVFNILLFMFVAKIFETLILHNGNKIKIKDLVKLSKAV